MDPQDYSARTDYRPPAAWYRRLNHVGVPAEHRAPVIAEYLRRGRDRSGEAPAVKQARYYFGLAPNATLEDIQAIAAYYPVFRIDYTTDA